jgi:cyclophilin family peptidyl-prolyl cis-trans isomerase
MNRIFFLIVAILTLSSCAVSEGPKTLDEKSVPPMADAFDYEGVKGRINEINNGLAPQVKPTGRETQPVPPVQMPPPGQQPASQPPPDTSIHLEDLAQVYNRAVLKTSMGDITIEFYPEDSPLTVNNFLNLAKKGFYDGTKLLPDKDGYILGGDPNTKDGDPSNDGQGGPGYRFQSEINSHKLAKGSIAMASFKATGNGSQFFIVTADELPSLQAENTNFGYVVEGMEIADAITNAMNEAQASPAFIKTVVLQEPTGRGSGLIDELNSGG